MSGTCKINETRVRVTGPKLIVHAASHRGDYDHYQKDAALAEAK